MATKKARKQLSGYGVILSINTIFGFGRIDFALDESGIFEHFEMLRKCTISYG